MDGRAWRRNRSAEKLYHFAQVQNWRSCCSDVRLWQKVLRGVPKGSRENNLERHSRGRGRMNKATRPFGDCCLTLQPPCHQSILQNWPKNEENSLWSYRSVNNWRHRLCTTKYTSVIRVLRVYPWPTYFMTSPSHGPRCATAYAPRFQSVPSNGTASLRRPMQCRRYPDAPKPHRP